MHSVIEIIFFAAIALTLLTAFLDMLGKVDVGHSSHNKRARNKGADSIRTVEEIGQADTLSRGEIESLKDLIYAPEYTDKLRIMKDVYGISDKLSWFNANSFLQQATKAVTMIVEALKSDNHTVIQNLVDRRTIDEVMSSKEQLLSSTTQGKAMISDVYYFGNSVFIKVLFNEQSPKQEWSFTKSMLSLDKAWYVNSLKILQA